MFSLKRSLIAIVGILGLVGTIILVMPRIGQGQGGNPLTRDTRHQFYLTKTSHSGSQALSACATGYHMASLWEIFYFSNLKYNSELGATVADSGFGPPIGIDGTGWVRTGTKAESGAGPGFSNCHAWTTASENDRGTIAYLFLGNANGDVKIVTPWVFAESGCTFPQSVWCVQD
jgi:hypothetical protein